MVILGIDYGTKNIGLAIATGPLAEPLTNLKVTSRVYERLRKICLKLEVEKIVLGISESESARRSRKFAKELEEKLNIPIVFQDETLTTQRAIKLLAKARAKKTKRKGPKHKFAASLILQEYLDQSDKENN